MAAMLDNYFIKGLIIAVIFGVPAGAIGVLTIQRTLEKGFWFGFATGMGSTAADLLYASVSIFGISALSDLLVSYSTQIRLIGSVLIMAYGVLILLKRSDENKNENRDKKNIFSCFAYSFVMAVMNPAMLVSYAVAFTAVGITGTVSGIQGFSLIVGVFAGTTLWWLIISGVMTVFRGKITEKIYRILNLVLGTFLIVFAMVIAVSAFAEN